MPDLDFSKLPVILQYFAMIGAVLGGAYMMLRGTWAARAQPVPEVKVAQEAAQLAAQLADARLRQELETILHAMRDAISARIDDTIADLRVDYRSMAEENREEHKTLYRVTAALENRIHLTELDIARIKTRRQ